MLKAHHKATEKNYYTGFIDLFYMLPFADAFIFEGRIFTIYKFQYQSSTIIILYFDLSEPQHQMAMYNIVW